MNASTTSGYTGWRRPDQRSPWRAIVKGGDEYAVFQLLLSAVHGGDKCVLAAGVDPNTSSPRRRRL